jgi:type IV pilus assembly protein PilA
MIKWLKKLKKDERGLTLVELLAVVVILAIVAAIAFVLIGNVIDNSKKDAQIANAQQFISAVKLAEASGDVDVSSGVNAITLDTVANVVDPWDKKVYPDAFVTKDTNNVYAISLAGDKCEIKGKTEVELQEGRDKACN